MDSNKIFQNTSDFYSETSDFQTSYYELGNIKAHICYLTSVADDQKVLERIVRPFFEIGDYAKLEQFFSSTAAPVASSKECIQALGTGKAAIFIGSLGYLTDVRSKPAAPAGKASVETVIQGPYQSFAEDLQSNVSILRNRYPRPGLRVESEHTGTGNSSKIVMVYDAERVDKDMLEKVKARINKVEMELIQAAGQLQEHLLMKKRPLFPTLMITERPDRACLNLTQGKIAIFINGTPFALVIPSVFYDFMSSMEDVYQSYWISKFLVVLRYFGLFASLSLPALYVAITAYNPEIMRVQLTLWVAGSRMAIPYPAYIEILLMLVAMEWLIEASIRQPKYISSTATTVGGLILGQAATDAGLVSNIMIILVASVAISNFVIPINSMSFAMRVAKYILLLFAVLYGMIGFMLSFVGLVAYLISLDSFGMPYLRVFKGDDFKVKGGKV